jgi:hypothetical protein
MKPGKNAERERGNRSGKRTHQNSPKTITNTNPRGCEVGAMDARVRWPERIHCSAPEEDYSR